MSILHSLAGGWAEIWDQPTPAARARRAARTAGLVASHLVGQLALAPYAARCLALRASLPAATGSSQHHSRGPVALAKDVRYSSSPRATADVYTPTATTTAARPPVALLVHGGTWSAGAAWHVAPAAAALAARGVVTAAINYSLWPAGCIDDAVTDVRAALDWARSPAGAAVHGGDPERVTLIGHSAGGHLVAAAALADARPPPIVALAGVFDLPDHYEFERRRGVHRLSTMARAALGRGGPPPPVSAEKSVVAALDAASPVARLRVSKLPPRSLFVGGSRDSVVPASQSTRFATALRAAGAAAVTDTVIDADHADFVTAWGGWGRVEGVPSQWGESVVEFVLK